jgi:hypothetical protein
MKDIQIMKREAQATTNKRCKENYQLARSLGFDSIEARILSKRSARHIREMGAIGGSFPVTDVTNEKGGEVE